MDAEKFLSLTGIIYVGIGTKEAWAIVILMHLILLSLPNRFGGSLASSLVTRLLQDKYYPNGHILVQM